MHHHARALDSLHPRALAVRPYDRGLHDLGSGTFAYLQPNGSWGWSNAGLIVDGEDALLVDTLFDLHLTASMLTEMRRADRRAARIDTLINTHANLDHTNGNSLLPNARVITSARAAQEMSHETASMLASFMRHARTAIDPTSRYLLECFGDFDFEGIPDAHATDTFVGRKSMHVGHKRIELIELGAAHTGGDIIVHVPDDRIVYTGDLLFIGGHPIMWAGPIDNWISACDDLLDLDIDYVVPGHGPITDKRGILAMREYLSLVRNRAVVAHEAQLTPHAAASEIARDLRLNGFEDWIDGERLIVTVSNLYRELNRESTPLDVGAMFTAMATFKP